MSQRVTIMIDDDLDKKIRILQANEIRQTQGSVSFSKMINTLLRSKLK